MSLAEVARAYASAGFAVFPLQPSSKVPYKGSRGCLEATTHSGLVSTWWTSCPDANVGLACGEASRLWVLDLDVKHGVDGAANMRALAAGRELPTTFTVRTPSGGLHLYFRHVEGLGNTAGKLAPGVDTRGQGGYVLAPGSVIDGEAYDVVHSAPIAEIPAWLVELARTPAVTHVAPVERPEGVVYHRLTRNDLEAFGARTRKPELAEAVRLVLEGKSWAPQGGRYVRMRDLLASLWQWVYGTHAGAWLDPDTGDLFAASCAAVNAEGVEQETSPAWVACMIAELEGKAAGVAQSNAEERAKLEAEADAFVASLPKPAGPAPTPPDPGRPAMGVGCPDDELVMRTAIGALARRDDVYVRQGKLTEVVRDWGAYEEQIGLEAREIPSGRMVTILSSAVQWIGKGEDDPIVRCPDAVATRVLQQPTFPGVKRLLTICSTPTMGPRGEILSTEGYHEGPCALLDFGGVPYPALPEAPTLADARACAEALLAYVDEFPYADRGQRSVWLSYVLSSIALDYCVHTPLHLFGASNQGAGKGLLAKVAHAIVSRTPASIMTWPGDQEEQSKKLCAEALRGSRNIQCDNVAAELGGPVLEASLTERTRIRVLGQNVMAPPLQAVICVTANGARVSPDMARRTLELKLTPSSANHANAGIKYRIEDPDQHARDRHPLLFVAALTILRAWQLELARAPRAVRRVGSFGRWSTMVGGAIEWLGLPHPATFLIANNKDRAASADERTTAKATVLRALDEAGKLSAAELLLRANKHPGDEGYEAAAELAGALELLCGIRGGARLTVQGIGQALKRLDAQGEVVPVDDCDMRLSRAFDPHSKAWRFSAEILHP